MANKPITREEKYLAHLTGDYTGELPKPITRIEKYLYGLCRKGVGTSEEEIKQIVQDYFTQNPVQVSTDKTLTEPDKAADAAAVGEKIGVLNDIICGTPHTGTVEEYLNRQRTGVVYQSKEWKAAVNPTTVIEKLGVNNNEV